MSNDPLVVGCSIFQETLTFALHDEPTLPPDRKEEEQINRG